MTSPFSSQTFGRDFLASIVVFLVALPLCMGISLASGMPPTAGIVTGIIGGIIVGSISGAPLQVSGPAAGLSVLVWQLVNQFGADMLGVIVLFAGLIQLAAGLGGLGQWFRAVSPAVINGMLAGIGVLIFASQFHVMLDYKPIGTGIENLMGIPRSIMGTNDLLKESRARALHNRIAVVPWLAMSLVAARAFGLDILDGVYNDFRDEAGFCSECEHGRILGMDGKTLIHPSQVGPCNEIFSPTEEEISWAHKIIAAFEQPEYAHKGVITVEGKMVERLHLVQAKRTVAIANSIAAMRKVEEPWF